MILHVSYRWGVATLQPKRTNRYVLAIYVVVSHAEEEEKITKESNIVALALQGDWCKCETESGR